MFLCPSAVLSSLTGQTVKGGVQGMRVWVPYAQRPDRAGARRHSEAGFASVDTLTGYRKKEQDPDPSGMNPL